jgi:hypothetical protein
MNPSHMQPVRPRDDQEVMCLDRARERGAFVAWRDGPGNLRIHHLVSREAVTIGRAAPNTVMFDHLLISRDHAEVVMVVRGDADSTTVYLHDLWSKHGTEHRRVPVDDRDRASLALKPAATRPAGRAGLQAGDHDVLLAGEVWLRVGAVPVDRGVTGSRGDDLPAPTPRERDVLVELCRPRFETPGRHVATPSNAEIGAWMRPAIKAARVSDMMSAMYVKYELSGTNVQNRLELVELALRHRLVGPADYS